MSARPPFAGRSPRAVARQLERARPRPREDGRENFIGYGVMALPFAGGDLLALRRFVVSSIGPGYTAVWHRDPAGRWTFYIDVEPMRGCPRYFGAELSEVVVTPIELRWTGPDELSVAADGVRLEWALRLGSSPRTRALGLLVRALPEPLWRRERVLAGIGGLGGRALDAGRLALTGRTPNGQGFALQPRRIWTVQASAASVRGRELGPIGRLPEQVRLADFLLPAAPLFAAGVGSFEALDALRHCRSTGRRVVRG